MHGILRQSWDPDHVEMTEQPGCDRHSPSAGRSASTNELGIGNLLPKQLLLVIESAIVNHLAQELNGRLCPIVLQHRHVHIIHKENHSRSGRSPKKSLALALQAVLELVYNIGSAGLSTEVCGGGREQLSGRVQVLLDDNGLAHTCLSTEEDVEVGHHHIFDHHPLTNCFGCVDQNVEERLVRMELKLWHYLCKWMDPSIIVADCHHVQIATVRNLWAEQLKAGTDA
mmetsp:Transcript_13884/g.32984  ORF Transcript_13884/g.32984 Transcript_13884/m.32984 type:complete len:227 (+) Transcript_13884:5746-6426(+)